MKGIIALSLLLLYTVCEYAAYIPQLVKLIKTKSAGDLSVASWITWVVFGICYLAYILLESPQIGVIYIASMNLCFMVIVCILTIHYQKNKKFQKYVKKLESDF